MCKTLPQVISALRTEAARLEPARLSTDQASTAFEQLAEGERIIAGMKMLLAPRLAEGRRWAEAGHRSAASWMAEVAGTGIGDAMSLLEVGERLENLSTVTEALRLGKLSAPQAKEVATAATSDPAAERELVSAAGREGLKQLKDRCRRIRRRSASQKSLAEREEQIRRCRYLRHWRDDDGAFRLDAKLTASDGAQIMAALEAEARVVFDEVDDPERHEPQAAYLADALVRIARQDQRAQRRQGRLTPAATVSLRVDLAALRRGSLHNGETCEIPGVGPVSLATARGLLGDSFLKLLVTDGVDVQAVAHRGRTIPAHVRSALEERDRFCVVPGCGASKFLEIDHWQVPFAEGGPTALWNLARLCKHHHRLKTHGGFELVGGPGNWQFLHHSRAGPSALDGAA